MGYHTDFSGELKLDSPLTREQNAYLTRFADSRRMKRNSDIASQFADPLREAVGLPIGLNGGYFVGTIALDTDPLKADDPRKPSGTEQLYEKRENNCCGQFHDASVMEYNYAPKGQPGLWNHWAPNRAGTAIEWDGGEKFYFYTEWVKYIIEHFLKPWGKTLNGEIEWQGEESSDIGKIVVKDNVVTERLGSIVYDL